MDFWDLCYIPRPFCRNGEHPVAGQVRQKYSCRLLFRITDVLYVASLVCSTFCDLGHRLVAAVNFARTPNKVTAKAVIERGSIRS